MGQTIAVSPDMQATIQTVDVKDDEGNVIGHQNFIESNIQIPETNAEGKQKYLVTDKYGVEHEPVWLAPGELSELKIANWLNIWLHGYTYTPVYKTLKDLIVVKPITDNQLASGAYVYFLASDQEIGRASCRERV